jgi:hypothetical protein
MDKNQYSEEIDLKQLAKKVILISKNRKKIFTTLLVMIMGLSVAYFVKVMIKPSYKSEVVLKSKYVRKDQLENIIAKYNTAIQEEDTSITKNVYDVLMSCNIVKIEISEIKPDITSPDKDDKTKYYKLISFHSEKPNTVEIEKIAIVINQIKEIASQDNDIIEGRKRTEKAIAEIDSLVNVAFEAGNSFKNKMNMPGNMMVMNDLYKSLNDILARKTGLMYELTGYQTANVIFKASPIILSKKITMPTIIFVIGFAVWFLICTVWVGGVLVFGDEE